MSRQARIRTLNDALRTGLTGGRIVMTRSVSLLPEDVQAAAFAALRTFDGFDADVESRWCALPHC